MVGVTLNEAAEPWWPAAVGGPRAGGGSTMGRLTASAACALALTASMVMFSAGTADAASPAKPAGSAKAAKTSASLPKTVLKIRSLDWQPRSGSVAVTARVKCTGRGSFSWQVSLEQKKARDKGSANVPCDGD